MANEFPQLELKLPKINPVLIKLGVAGVILLILLASSFYQIGPQETGVILRFGKFVRTTDPGLHLKLPLGVESLIKVPVQRQLKMEFGFRTTEPGIRTEYQVTPDSKREARMLTGDLNIVEVEWIVQYKIQDPYKYLFKLRDVSSTFRYMNEAVVRKIVGDSSVDEVITVGRARIALEAKEELQKLCDLYEIGIEVNQLSSAECGSAGTRYSPPSMKSTSPSRKKSARSMRPESDYNQVIPKAEGEAAETIQAAEGYATERINNAEGDANRFRAIYREYARAPLVTRKRLYLEA